MSDPQSVSHAEEHSPEEFRAHLKIYWLVFLALMVATAVTVAVAYVDFGGTAAVVVALIIASSKAAMVGAWFMHLIDDRKFVTITWTLILTGFMFLAMIFLMFWTEGGKMSMEALG